MTLKELNRYEKEKFWMKMWSETDTDAEEKPPMNYYERYMALGSKGKAIEQARIDTAVALLFIPESVKEIREALDRAVVDMRGETE